tara:strand:+ start:519 stop:638 length:120 start_codon:yes stop_codon:yes gene_type:complete
MYLLIRYAKESEGFLPIKIARSLSIDAAVASSFARKMRK